jgi:Type I restriction enzyme R protein N terminus (HSDR_N)
LALSKSNSLYDPVRGSLVAATPEERVRQLLLHHMIEQLGFPKSLISVEKGFPGAGRRFDILCHHRRGNELQPLLAIECKAGGSLAIAQEQIKSYNIYLGCPFIGVAVGDEVSVGWHGEEGWQFIEGLPSYGELVGSL